MNNTSDSENIISSMVSYGFVVLSIDLRWTLQVKVISNGWNIINIAKVNFIRFFLVPRQCTTYVGSICWVLVPIEKIILSTAQLYQFKCRCTSCVEIKLKLPRTCVHSVSNNSVGKFRFCCELCQFIKNQTADQWFPSRSWR